MKLAFKKVVDQESKTKLLLLSPTLTPSVLQRQQPIFDAKISNLLNMPKTRLMGALLVNPDFVSTRMSFPEGIIKLS